MPTSIRMSDGSRHRMASLMLGGGAWLFFAPFWMRSYGGPGTTAAAWNSYVVGLLVFLVGFTVLMRPMRWQQWASLLAGLWLMIAPFVLGLSSVVGTATSNHLLVGCLLGFLGFVTLAYRSSSSAADRATRT